MNICFFLPCYVYVIFTMLFSSSMVLPCYVFNNNSKISLHIIIKSTDKYHNQLYECYTAYLYAIFIMILPY